MRGTVVWFDNFKNAFGWIRPDDGSADIWVHRKDLAVTGFPVLLPGDKVNYDHITRQRKLKGRISNRLEAINVERVVDG